MIEFQSSSLNGNTLALDPNATLFNLYDNTTGKYLNLGAGGQHDVNTLAGWLSADPFLKGEALGQIRIGIGMAGGGELIQSLQRFIHWTCRPYPSPLPSPSC